MQKQTSKNLSGDPEKLYSNLFQRKSCVIEKAGKDSIDR